MRVFDADEMRAVERRAFDELGLPSLVLMENAALGAVDALGRFFPEARKVAILCGPGNNGGDGLAMARQLEGRGYDLEVFLVARERPRNDALVQLEILERSGIPVRPCRNQEEIAAVFDACLSADLVVDALFGIGLGRALHGHYAALVDGLNQVGKKVLAVDLPSGLDAGSAQVLGPTVKAGVTVTFGALKKALVLPPAADFCGEIVLADLGIPRFLFDEAEGSCHLISAEELVAELLPRAPEGHKGTFGHVLVVGGSPGKSGAVVLAARAALFSGAGLVTAAVPAPLLATVEALSLESMSAVLPCDDQGVLSRNAIEPLRALAATRSVVALGPGLGRSAELDACLPAFLAELEIPLVLDADGLNCLGQNLEILAERRAVTILTPHPGELARLLGLSVAEVEADRLAAAHQAARRAQAIVVLKGRRTIVALPEGELWINPSGCANLATGGSGDVLTGLIAALLGQGYGSDVAARLGVFLHGRAGEASAEARGPIGTLAGELIERLPAEFAELHRQAEV
jgi:ADP-dependent NAD(P)H-hydrate dehydratase / NAD(P)H-hydrate epimerase